MKLRLFLTFFALLMLPAVAVAGPDAGVGPAGDARAAGGAAGTAPAAAAEPRKDDPTPVAEVHLLVMGPGDLVFTRFGHAGLMIFRNQGGKKKYYSKVYNYGDAHFRASDFEWEFFRGTVKFFISTFNSLNETVTLYARENRTITHQRLNLTEEQVAQVEALLEHDLKPENRHYSYHHLRAGCATKIRDLLDRVLGGVIRKTLEPGTDPLTPRLYGRQVFAGHLGMEVFSDLFMGRLHDRRWNRYESICIPALLSTYLQEVMVPDPGGNGKLVPLAPPAKVLFRRRGPPPTAGEGRTLIHISYLWTVLILALGLFALVGQPHNPRRAGAWLMVWALPMGLASFCMLFGALVSTVIEGRINELLLVYPTTDLALIAVAWRWLKGNGTSGYLLRKYAWVRLGLVVLSLAGHAAGVLVQEPLSLVVMGLAAAVLLVLIIHRFPMPHTTPQVLRGERTRPADSDG